MIADDKALSICTCTATRMASRTMSLIYDDALAPADLRSGQFAMLRALRRLGPVGVQRLGVEMKLDRTTVGRTLRPLERDGLVSVEVDETDRRARLLRLTECARQRLEIAEPLWAALQDRLETMFGAGELRSLHASLLALTALNLSA